MSDPVPPPSDTHPSAERVQIELLRRATVARRVALAASLSQTTIGLARRALRRLHPQLDERELAVRFVELHYGAALAAGLRRRLEQDAGG